MQPDHRKPKDGVCVLVLKTQTPFVNRESSNCSKTLRTGESADSFLRAPRKRAARHAHGLHRASSARASFGHERCPTFNGAAGRAVGKTRISYSKPGDESSVSKDGCGIMERRRSDL